MTRSDTDNTFDPAPPSLRIVVDGANSRHIHDPSVEFFGSKRYSIWGITTPGGTKGVMKSPPKDFDDNAREKSRLNILVEIEAYRHFDREYPDTVPRLLSVDERVPSFVTERQGLDLLDTMYWMQSLPEPETVKAILLRLSFLLSRLHSGGISHNDIKPENVVQKHNGGLSELYLVDLESTKFREDHCHNGVFMTSIDGKTPGYAAPEAWRSSSLPIACWGGEDAFGLGRIALILLTRSPLCVRPDASSKWMEWATYTTKCTQDVYPERQSRVMGSIADTLVLCLRDVIRDLDETPDEMRLHEVTKSLLDPDPLTRMTCAEAHSILSGSDLSTVPRSGNIQAPDLHCV